MTPNTMAGRLFRILARDYPEWRGGPDELGICFHKAASRIGDTIEPAGYPVVSRTRKGKTWAEYRFADPEAARRARLQVASWASGIPVAELAASRGGQGRLILGGGA